RVDLFEYSGGTYTNRGYVNSPVTLSYSGTYTLKAVLSGSAITVYVNGQLAGSFTGITANQTATRFGLMGYSDATYTAHVFDNFRAEPSQTGSPVYAGRYTWTGRERDPETGLQYNRARYYDPFTARWMSQDPLGFDAGDSNLYRYVGNSEPYLVDP